MSRVTVLPNTREPAIGIEHASDEKIARGACPLGVVRTAGDERAAGERRDHQPVPAGDDLGVFSRRRPRGASTIKSGAGGFELSRCGVEREPEVARDYVETARGVDDAAAVLEVAGFADAVRLQHQIDVLARDDLANLGRGPREETAFFVDALRTGAVGVGGRVEAAGGVGHLAGDVVESLGGDRQEIAAPRCLIAFEIGDREQRVVVEHLLEVRHQPARVGRVTVEAAADAIAHPARGHALERVDGHVQRGLVVGAPVVAQQKLERHRARKLRRAAEPAEQGVERRRQLARRRGHHARRRQIAGRTRRRHRLQPLADGGRFFRHRVALARKPVAKRREHRQQARSRLRGHRRAPESRSPQTTAGGPGSAPRSSASRRHR